MSVEAGEHRSVTEAVSYTGQMRWVEAPGIWGEDKSPPTLQQLVRTVTYEGGVQYQEFLEWKDVPVVPHHLASMYA